MITNIKGLYYYDYVGRQPYYAVKVPAAKSKYIEKVFPISKFGKKEAKARAIKFLKWARKQKQK